MRSKQLSSMPAVARQTRHRCSATATCCGTWVRKAPQGTTTTSECEAARAEWEVARHLLTPIPMPHHMLVQIFPSSCTQRHWRPPDVLLGAGPGASKPATCITIHLQPVKQQQQQGDLAGSGAPPHAGYATTQPPAHSSGAEIAGHTHQAGGLCGCSSH
jgi:hypothetical protein